MDKVLYVRLPKNASTTIQRVLQDNGYNYISGKNFKHGKLIIEPLGLINNGTIPSNSLNGNLYETYNKLIGLDDYFTFAFVRNPWDRAVSSWEFLMRHPERPNKISSDLERKYGQMSFKDFVKKLKNGESLSNRDKWHIVPQFNSLSNKDGELEFDFIGRFENLEEDLGNVLTKIGIGEITLPHLMKSNHKKYVDYYDDDTINMVGEIFKNDIEHFNYTFE